MYMQLGYEGLVVTERDGETGPSSRSQLIGAEQSQDWKRTGRPYSVSPQA